MKRIAIMFVGICVLLATAHRLPAPIQEVPETPTPATPQSAKPKPKRTIKSKVTSSPAPVTPTPSNSRASPQTPQSATSLSANTQGYDTVALRPSGSMSGPKPQVPEEARGQHLTGVGIYILHFDKPTGSLIDVTISQSSGSTILDQGAIATLRQWHATPGSPREVPFTITYSVTGP